MTRIHRHPSFVVGGALSLGIGMSLATAVFGVVNAVLLRPLPFADSANLLHVTAPAQAQGIDPLALLNALRTGSTTVRAVAAFDAATLVVGRSGQAKVLNAAYVTPEFFSVAGVLPAVGAWFDAPEANAISGAVISNALWRSAFNARADVIGASVTVGGQPHQIIAVAPRAFDFPFQSDMWLPLTGPTASRLAKRGAYSMLVRVNRGSTVAEATNELALIQRRIAREGGRSPESPVVSTLRDHLTGRLKDQLQLWIAAAVVILIVCAVNFATMSFVRGMARRQELAVRRALGASRTRVVLDLVSDSVPVSVLGGLLAIGGGAWLLRFTNEVVATSGVSISPSLDWATVVFATAGATTVGLGFALIPALDASRVELKSVMQGSSGPTARQGELRSRRALVGLQVSLALVGVSLVAAIVSADAKFQRSEIGVDYSRLLTGSLYQLDSTDRVESVEPVLAVLRSTPGVDDVSAYGACNHGMAYEERSADRQQESIACLVTPRFFQTLALRPVRGRFPTQEDASNRMPVVVVSRGLARQMFGSESGAINGRLRILRPGWNSEWVTVIGVIDDIGDGLFGFSPSIYRAQDFALHKSAGLVVRSIGEPRTIVASAGNSLQRGDPRVTVTDLAAVTDVLERQKKTFRGRRAFLGSVAILTLLLAVIGVFSLTSYSTALRSRELGIRIALGAKRSHLYWAVTGNLWWIAAVGSVVGLIVSAKATAFLDAYFRPAYLREPLVSLPAASVATCTVALLLIVVLGTAASVSRVLKIDVARAVQGN